jgi:hypothetical protein
VTSARQLTRAEILALPPVCTLTDLAAALGVSEPTVRSCLRKGELERLGIRVNKLGAQHRVITATVLDHLGLADGASAVPPSRRAAGQGKAALRAVGSATGTEDRAPPDLSLHPLR